MCIKLLKIAPKLIHTTDKNNNNDNNWNIVQINNCEIHLRPGTTEQKQKKKTSKGRQQKNDNRRAESKQKIYICLEYITYLF